eukprot:TRINITY_DN34668_c0_g1_i1.p1 TRINITY_DN34668_c0_g1~~TRINITY_DN34668_c0_g1_i1.p1  ORF type:complete len:585 (+),score=88.09 TRINITY_DN34668_c0_g1_i1:266-2020(+)
MSGTAPNDKDRILGLFRQMDRNGDGTIGSSELGSVLTVLNPSVWNENSIGRLMSALDVNRDNKISYNEFLQWAWGAGRTVSFCAALRAVEERRGVQLPNVGSSGSNRPRHPTGGTRRLSGGGDAGRRSRPRLPSATELPPRPTSSALGEPAGGIGGACGGGSSASRPPQAPRPTRLQADSQRSRPPIRRVTTPISKDPDPLSYSVLRRQAAEGAGVYDYWDQDDTPKAQVVKKDSSQMGHTKPAWGVFTCSRGSGGGVKVLNFSMSKGTMSWKEGETSREGMAFGFSMGQDTPREQEGTMSALDAVHGEKMTWVRGEVIGEGTMGVVYRALNQRTGEVMAVKEVPINQESEADMAFELALENELDICIDLKHSRIVSYLGHDRIGDRLFVYMEFMPGGSLAEVLQQFGPLDESLASVYARAVTEGVEYLHAQKPPVLHRDIKGGNILVGLDCQVKLADFGCSKRVDESASAAQSMRGSIPWMAPEVVMRCGYGRKADVWSLGCVVIEMTSGTTPWGKIDNPMLALRKIGMSKLSPPVPDSMSPIGADFVERCVKRDQTERWTAQEALRHDFLKTNDDWEISDLT